MVGVGNGPKIGVIRELGNIFFVDHRTFWIALCEDGYLTPHLPSHLLLDSAESSSDSSEGRTNNGGDLFSDLRMFFIAFGFFWRLCLLWDVDCCQLSPMFALVCLTGNRDIPLGYDVLSAVAPDLFKRLTSNEPQRVPETEMWDIRAGGEVFSLLNSVWPEAQVRGIPHRCPDYGLHWLINYYLQPANLRNLSDQAMASLWNSVLPTLVFGSEWKTLDEPANHVVVRAIRDGLDYKGGLWGKIVEPFLVDTMGAVDLVKSLWTARKATWQGVMSRLELNPDRDGGVSVALINRWVACLRRYLQASPPRTRSPSMMTPQS